MPLNPCIWCSERRYAPLWRSGGPVHTGLDLHPDHPMTSSSPGKGSARYGGRRFIAGLGGIL